MGISSILIAACASDVKKAEISNSANPQEEITKLDNDIAMAATKNIDVLAMTDFRSSVKWNEEAKEDLASHKKQEKILDDVRTGRGFLEKAYMTSENREAKASGLFEARQAALKAGAGKHPELRSEWKDIDSDVSAKADSLETVSTENLSKFQNRYVDLERKATILTQLSSAQAMINGAKKDGAAKIAPVTLKKTELAAKSAESVISTNVRNPEGYKTAVMEANNQATLLQDLMMTFKENGKSLSEPAALKLVFQARKIKSLDAANAEKAAAEVALQKKNQELATDLENKNKDLTVTQQNLNATTKDLSATNENLNATKKDLSSATQDLSTAKASVEIQKALETARSQFSTEEAEAYQQGNNLLIRLKKVNFASGHADLPGNSLPLLAKVSEVAKSLKATEIKVEGHTDSLGTAVQNKTISEQRAQAVASYFKSNGFKDIDVQSTGFGFDKPIATNKSKEGRAQNRRVDIIITPENTATH